MNGLSVIPSQRPSKDSKDVDDCPGPGGLTAIPAAAGIANENKEITWHSGTFLSAIQKAGAEKKTVLVYFWSDGSGQCSRMYTGTMAESSVVGEMNQFVCFSANTADANAYKLVERYNVKVLPTILIVQPPGSIEDAVMGYIDAEPFVAELQRIRAGKDTISDFKRRAEAAPDDLEVQMACAVKLQDCGDLAGYERVTARMVELDPKGETLIVSRLLLGQVQEPIVAAAKRENGEYDFKAANLEPLVAFLEQVPHEEVKFEGWRWAGEIALAAEDKPRARSAAMEAWPHAPEEYAPEYAYKLVHGFFEDRDELSRSEKKFVVDVANSSHQMVMHRCKQEAKEVRASGAQGCASYEGHPEGEGCGGCPGVKGELTMREASSMEVLALAYFIDGKKSKALATVKKGLELAPEHERLNERLAMLTRK